MLLDDLRLEGPVAIPRRLQRDHLHKTLYTLRCRASQDMPVGVGPSSGSTIAHIRIRRRSHLETSFH